MNNREIIEALIFSGSGALQEKDILKALPDMKGEEVEGCVAELNRTYLETGRSFRIERAAAGYMFVTREEYTPYLKALHTPSKLTMAALEALAVIAYKGPCPKQMVASIRGVDSTSSLKSLLKHQLIDIKNGKPLTYYTTPKFLEVFGLESLNDLPDLKQFEEVFREEAGEDANAGSGAGADAGADPQG
jgi:segregation and condensation protein B